MKLDFRKFIFPIILSVVLWSILFFTRTGEPYYALEAFWLVGIILLLLTLLFWVTNEGVFNSISWGFGKILDIFRPVPKQTLKYIEYVEAKRSKPKISTAPYAIIGAAFFMIGLIWWLIIN
jgi:hypothetical protein